jgi:adenosylcobinamide amidohydrolase
MITTEKSQADRWSPMDGFAGLKAIQRGRFLIACFEGPWRCLNTSAVNGGEQSHLTHVFNHQSCEGTGHQGRDAKLHGSDPYEYHAFACDEASLPPATTAMLGTAAGMHYAACSRLAEGDDEVAVWATGGVKGNAGRAGDPAHWREGESGWVRTEDPIPAAYRGTINLMAFFNQPVSPGGLARAAALLAESKAAVLQELGFVSRVSRGLATGTGTDQFSLASPIPLPSGGKRERTWPGHHSKLGEILALAAQSALRETLRWQNGLEPSLARNIGQTCRRFGLTTERLEEIFQSTSGKSLDAVSDGLNSAALFLHHREALYHHPAVSAGASLFAELEDRIEYGTLPRDGASALRLGQAA